MTQTNKVIIRETVNGFHFYTRKKIFNSVIIFSICKKHTNIRFNN